MMESNGMRHDASTDEVPREPKLAIAQQTFERLLDCVLQCSSAPIGNCPQQSLPEPCQSVFESCVADDAAFARWYAEASASHAAAEHSAATLIATVHANDWVAILVKHPTWRDGSPASERLWASLNVLVRLRTLEHRFAADLDALKRESIYHFAYGLSHELNNPLANIATRAGLLVHDEPTADRRQLLETIIDNAMRGTEMLGDLMLIARPPRIEPRATAFAPWFSDFAKRCEKWSRPFRVEFISSHTVAASTVEMDPVAVSEALWCLVRNAIEASRAGQRVRLTCREAPKCLEFTVLDQGPGLSAVALRHCFDPFYSGREAGRGLGLGLAKARMIAEKHSGQLAIANYPAGGCEATLTVRADRQ